MLVDDNDTDNFISKRIIEITRFATRVEVKGSGKAALDYLRENQDTPENLPSLIFLDINMPIVSGCVEGSWPRASSGETKKRQSRARKAERIFI